MIVVITILLLLLFIDDSQSFPRCRENGQVSSTFLFYLKSLKSHIAEYQVSYLPSAALKVIRMCLFSTPLQGKRRKEDGELLHINWGTKYRWPETMPDAGCTEITSRNNVQIYHYAFPLLYLTPGASAVCRDLEASGEGPAPRPPLHVASTIAWKARQPCVHSSHYTPGSSPGQAQTRTWKAHLGCEAAFSVVQTTLPCSTQMPSYGGTDVGTGLWKTDVGMKNSVI